MEQAIIATFAWGIGGILGNIFLFWLGWGLFVFAVANEKPRDFFIGCIVWIGGLAWAAVWMINVVVSIINWVNLANGVS